MLSHNDVNPITLQFRNPSIEKRFIGFYNRKNLSISRIGLTVALVSCLLSIIIGQKSSPDIYIILIASVLAIATLLTFIKSALPYQQYNMFITLTLVGLLITAFIQQGSIGNAALVGTAIMAVFIIFGYLLLNLLYIYSAISILCISLLFSSLILQLGSEIDRYSVANIDFFLTQEKFSSGPTIYHIGVISTVNFIAFLGSYMLERMERMNFSNILAIEHQKELIDKEKEAAEQLLYNILPKPIARQLKASTEIIADNFQEASVLFAGIANFNQVVASMEHQERVEKVNEVFKDIDTIMQKYRIEKIKTIGINYMAASGVPTYEPAHAGLMINAAQEILLLKDKWSNLFGTPVQLTIGIHLGSVIAGVIGKDKFSYDIWGDTVNIASRMQSLCLPNHVQVSNEFYLKVKNQFNFECRGEIEVKGKGVMKSWLLTT